MNKDIRIATSFSSNKKRIRLQRKLGPQGVLALIDLWIYAAENKPDGILSNMDDEDICIAAKWDGDVTAFIEALTDKNNRWLDKHPKAGWYKLHDWEEHNSYVVHYKERSEAARYAAEKRWEKKYGNGSKCGEQCAAQCGPHKSAMQNDANGNAPFPSPSPSPSPSPNNAPLNPPEGECMEKGNVDFMEIWNLYPSSRRTTRKNAEKAYRTARKKISQAALLEALTEFVNSPYVQSRISNDPGRIPLLTTWLNEERWTEDRSAWQIVSGGNGSAHGSQDKDLSPEEKEGKKLDYYRRFCQEMKTENWNEDRIRNTLRGWNLPETVIEQCLNSPPAPG
ncbi:MAG TPA: hypothetical protein PK360_07235 [bacterium]|nr:hypothetical protein [bacterium]